MAIFIGEPDGISWSAARAKVRGDLWRPGNSLPDDVVNRALHASILDLEGECKWLWLENITTLFEMVDEAASIALPASVGRISALSIRRPIWLEPLRAAPLAVVRENARQRAIRPTRYAQGDDAIWFDAIIPANTEFEMIFSAQTPETIEDALEHAPIALQRQQQAVIANACSHIALTFMKNEDEAARQRAVYERIVDRLLNVEAEKRGGMIQPDTWGNSCG